ncbi:hypothetical protein P8452_49727 [Trifolium repens]|jgi:hypothetical protein|nr:hypothetical protein P8452_49727 [Trifolium repens]
MRIQWKTRSSFELLCSRKKGMALNENGFEEVMDTAENLFQNQPDAQPQLARVVGQENPPPNHEASLAEKV